MNKIDINTITFVDFMQAYYEGRVFYFDTQVDHKVANMIFGLKTGSYVKPLLNDIIVVDKEKD